MSRLSLLLPVAKLRDKVPSTPLLVQPLLLLLLLLLGSAAAAAAGRCLGPLAGCRGRSTLRDLLHHLYISLLLLRCCCMPALLAAAQTMCICSQALALYPVVTHVSMKSLTPFLPPFSTL